MHTTRIYTDRADVLRDLLDHHDAGDIVCYHMPRPRTMHDDGAARWEFIPPGEAAERWPDDGSDVEASEVYRWTLLGLGLDAVAANDLANSYRCETLPMHGTRAHVERLASEQGQ